MGIEKPKIEASIYRTPTWSLIANTGFFIGIFLFLAIPIMSFFTLVLNNDPIDNTPKQIVGLISIAMLGLFFAGPFLALIPYSVTRYFLTYIKLTQEAIEYRNWPYHWRQIKWKDTKHIGENKALGLINRDVLFVQNAEDLSWQLWQRLRSNQKINEMIPLEGFNGWPDGQLADDIKKYAPHLFTLETE